MYGRAQDHVRLRGPRAAARLLAVALVAMVAGAPVASSWHELTVRHVRCAEHGELTHVRASQGGAAVATRDIASVEREAADTQDAHEHCSTGFLVRGRVHLTVVRALVRFTPPPAVALGERPTAPSPGRAVVLASAPKTSPPSA